MQTVLIAEDEKLIRQGLAAMIARAPVPVARILQANNGQTAWEILQTEEVDVLVTDIRMPEMTGVELVAKTKTLARVPLCIIVSGFDDFNYAVEMIRNGARDYLLKPVERQKLYEVLELLEKELLETSAALENTKHLQKQAIRYLMTTAEISPQEREKLILRHEAQTLFSAYQVVCTKRPVSQVPPSAVHLEDVEGLHVYIAQPGDVNALQAQVVYTAGCSDVAQAFSAVHLAYRQAVKRYQSRFFGMPDAQNPQYDSAKISEVLDKELTQMTALLGISRWKEVARILRTQISRVQNGQLEPDVFAKYSERFARAIADSYRAMVTAMDEQSKVELVANVWRYDTLQAYQASMESWLETFAQYLCREFDDYQNKQKIRDGVKYVQEHFDTALNMAEVSNFVSMNYSLFSLLFKQYVGENFVPYLQNIRVEAAQKLLRETELRVNEIGRKVGFSDDKNFLKVFKSICGLSPSEYRKASQMKEE